MIQDDDQHVAIQIGYFRPISVDTSVSRIMRNAWAALAQQFSQQEHANVPHFFELVVGRIRCKESLNCLDLEFDVFELTELLWLNSSFRLNWFHWARVRCFIVVVRKVSNWTQIVCLFQNESLFIWFIIESIAWIYQRLNEWSLHFLQKSKFYWSLIKIDVSNCTNFKSSKVIFEALALIIVNFI